MKTLPKYVGLSQRQNNAFQVAVHVETPSTPIHGYAVKIVTAAVASIANLLKTINAKVGILPMHAGMEIQNSAFQAAVDVIKKEVYGYARRIADAVVIANQLAIWLRKKVSGCRI